MLSHNLFDREKNMRKTITQAYTKTKIAYTAQIHKNYAILA